jgi:hypothetical protein
MTKKEMIKKKLVTFGELWNFSTPIKGGNNSTYLMGTLGRLNGVMSHMHDLARAGVSILSVRVPENCFNRIW